MSTNDDREALAEIATQAVRLRPANAERIADAILAAGYRRASTPPEADAELEDGYPTPDLTVAQHEANHQIVGPVRYRHVAEFGRMDPASPRYSPIPPTVGPAPTPQSVVDNLTAQRDTWKDRVLREQKITEEMRVERDAAASAAAAMRAILTEIMRSNGRVTVGMLRCIDDIIAAAPAAKEGET